MTGSERRAWLKAHLNGTTPIAGHELSQTLGVSRQVVVQDIALLRAEGHPIISTPRGYMIWEKPSGSIRQVLAVKHSDDPHIVRQELLTLVSHHVTVLNVIVAHPLYGELVGNLNLTSSDDVDNFLQTMQSQGAALLSQLTDGVHLHTVEGTPDNIARAKHALQTIHILLQPS